MDSVKVLEYVDAVWHSRLSTWEEILHKNAPTHACLIFSSAAVVANMPDAPQTKILKKFQINPFLMSKTGLELNGFSDCKSVLDQRGDVVHHNHWSRFVIKQTSSNLRAKRIYNSHAAGPEAPQRQEKDHRRPYRSIHDHQSAPYGWVWYEMGIAVNWTRPHGTTVLCFDIPEHLQNSIQSALKDGSEIKFHDPYAILSIILNELISQYDDSVWSLRNHISKWEADRRENPDYPLLHEIARHVIHVSETLGVARRSIQSLQQQRQSFIMKHSSKKHDPSEVYNPFDLQLQVIQNLHSRSESNSARLQNEMSLAFHTATERDSSIQVRIAQEAHREATAMKAIAVLTMIFLPATFLSSLFSMPFFESEPRQAGTKASFTVSDQFWIYWAFAVPLTIATFGVWVLWDRILRKNFAKGS